MIPSHASGEFYVGYEGSTNGQSVTRAWTYGYSDGNGAMKLLPTSSSIVGQATGAKGTISIWDDSGWQNQNVGFTPDGYGITYGGVGHAFNTTATANMLETDVVTLPDVSTTYTMGLATSSAGTYVTCAHSSAAEAISAMGVSILDAGKKKILLDPGSFNTANAVYAVWDVTNSTWGDGTTKLFTDADGDGVWECPVASTCTNIILVRLSEGTTASNINWSRKWNQTSGSSTIAVGDLLQKYTITSLEGDNCTYTTTAIHPATGDKGKFRMWANSADNNWYVHWIPYYVLSYDGNGGTGTTAATERNSESVTLTVNTAANGFTAPTGYQFAGWANSDARADAGTVDYAAGASYTLTSNATLYAVWQAKNYTITLNNQSATVAGTTSVSATYNSNTNIVATIICPTKTGYYFDGYYTETGGNGTQLIDRNGNFIASVSGYTDASKNWIHDGDVTLYAKWTALTLTLTLSPTTIAPSTATNVTYTITTNAPTNTTVPYYYAVYNFGNPDPAGGYIDGDHAVSGGLSQTVSVTKTAGTWYTQAVIIWGGAVVQTSAKVSLVAGTLYTVTYNANGGSVEPSSVTQASEGASVTLATPTRSGYTFQNWVIGGATYAASASYTPTADITAYATWKENCAGGGGSTTLITITPTITSDNKNNASASASGTPGGTAYWTNMSTSSPYKLSSSGAYFALKLSSGYYQATDVLVINGADKAHHVYYGAHGSGTALGITGSPSSGTINFTLTGLPSNIDEIYVYRSSDTYNGKLSSISVTRTGSTCYYVTYNGNGADGGYVNDPEAYSANDDPTVLANGFTKAGYEFTGWNTQAGGGGTSYAEGATITDINANITLYAQWALPCSTVPTVSAGSNSAVASTTATVSCTGGITSLGTGGCIITSYGFVLGTSANPTLSNTVHEVGTSIAASTGFSKNLTGLTPSTTYYVRPYATNGQGTAYGTQTSFTTSAAALVHWTMNLNTSTWGAASTETTDGTNITSIATSRTNGSDGTRSGATAKVTMASAEVSDNSSPSNSANFTFTVNSAKKVVPEKVTCEVFNVSSGSRTYKAQISDNNGHVYNSTNTLAVSSEATLTDATFNFAAGGVLVGNVTLKIYAWGSGSEFRMGQHVKLYGEVQNAANYTVTHTLSNVTKSAGETSVKEGNNYTATYEAAIGYELPATISVTIGGTPATAGTDYTWTQGTGVISIPGNKVTGNIVITVNGEVVTSHSVTYNGNSNTGGSVPTDANTYEENDIVTVLGNSGSLTKTGYVFRGWNTASDYSGTFYPADYQFEMPNSNVTLYAVWGTGRVCYKITDFETSQHNSSSNKPDSQGKYIYGYMGTTDAAHALTITTDNTNNKGENSGANMKVYCGTSIYVYADNTTTGGTPATFSSVSAVSLKIKMLNSSYHTTFTIKVGSTTIANSVSLEGDPQSGYTLFSYEDLANLSGKITITNNGSGSSSYNFSVDDIEICTGSGSSGYTVTFDNNGEGSYSKTIENVPSGSKIGKPIPDPTAAGSTFDGWYKEAGCSNAWNFASDVVSSDVTIYAKWLNCRPVITTQPSGAVYVLGNVPAALNVVATGDVTGYQWYSNDENNATSGTLIAGATTAGYTPELSIIGTTYYYCVVTNACGSTTTNVVAIVCNDSRANPTATWTVAEPTHGGQGFSFSVTAYQNDNISLWDGTLTVAMLTASEGVVLGEVTVDNTTKTISGTYGVEASATSPVTFYLSLPGTTNCCAATLDYNRTFTACAGGAGDSYNVRVRKDYEKDASNNYRWVTAGAGEITYAVGSSISSAKASSAVGVFDSIMSNDKQYLWIKTYEANTKTVRIHVLTGGKNISVSTIYQNTNYAAVADKDIVSSDDYSVTYDGSGSAENFGAKGIHYVDIEFDSPLEANDIICVKFSTSNVKAYGAVLTTVGDGGTQTTTLAWSNSQASGATLTKQEDDIDFAVTATRNNPAAIASLGAISYTSSNTAIATINSSTGLVHIADDIDFGEAAYKTTTITATLAASGCYKKATITYTLQVNKHVCEEAAGTISYVDNGCSGMTLSVSGYEDGATIQWYKDNSPVGTNSATYNATTAGEYHVVTTKTCSMTSTNSIVLALASASAEKIVDEWYVKNGRRTPDIALVQTTDARSFTVTSGGSTITEIGGCTFELKDDGIIYLHGSKPDGSAPSGLSAGDMTITITVSGCGGALSGLDIVIHKQDATTRPSIAFVVDGTEGGSFDAENESHSINTALYQFLDHGSDNLGAFDLTGQNIYSTVDEKAIRQHYSQFDAIVITDDPNTGTKSGSTSYVDAFGTMIDIRPILSMEAYVSKLKNWGSKGVAGSPSSPNPRQYEMRLQCKDHEIYSDLPAPAPGTHVWSEIIDGEEYRHVIMVDSTQSPYAGVAYNEQTAGDKLPALQGFASEDMGHLLGLGLILNGTLHAGVERQEEPAARMMILGIQSKALPNALTDEGKKVIENAITYLLKTNMEEVDDCSNFFKGGDSSKPRDWQTVANWYKGTLPTYETKVRILAPCELSGATVRVAQVDIVSSGTSSKMPGGTCSGSLTIASDAALIVTGKVRSAEAPHFASNDLKPTELGDLTIKADETNGNGTLIFDNKDGNTQAVVEMYSKAQNSVGSWSWQYVAVPFNDNSSAYRNYYGSWLYRWAEDNSGWEVVPNRGAVYPWIGYCLTQETAKQYVMDGTLVETTEQEFTVGSNQDMVIGNSWTAPIQVKQFTDDDFGGLTKNIYLFNTGLDVKKEGTINPVGTDGDARYEAGTYVVVPIHSAEYTGDSLISSLQAFTINNSSGSDATLTLDYDRHIRPTRSTDKVNAGPMHAPKRMAEESDKPVVLKILVSGDRYDDRLVLLEREDFSRGYDAGWDGEKILIGGNSQEIFSVMESGQESVTATPDMDGTVIGFRAGEDDIYTFHFEYDGYDEPLYLLDTDTKIFTRVVTGNIYTFMCTDKRESNRFLLTRKNAQDAPTDNANIRDEYSKPLKFLNNDKIYIYVRGVLYDITGKVVK
ncbi:MAG: InlB B-repeat-containing protein [Paludibacteraceae bacterium]|nr:InlB B-repeat-containing protein [Paludibacteraceae bacterium]